MIPWLNRLCSKPAAATAPTARSVATGPDAPRASSPPDPASAPAAEAAAESTAPGSDQRAEDPGRACGWFDSSLDLREGLAVSELDDPDWTVMVLWFGPAALRRAAHLH